MLPGVVQRLLPLDKWHTTWSEGEDQFLTQEAVMASGQPVDPATFRLPVMCSLDNGALRWRLLGKQPKSLSGVYGSSIKTGTGVSQAGSAWSAKLAISTCISSAASRLAVRFSPVCLN